MYVYIYIYQYIIYNYTDDNGSVVDIADAVVDMRSTVEG